MAGGGDAKPVKSKRDVRQGKMTKSEQSFTRKGEGGGKSRGVLRGQRSIRVRETSWGEGLSGEERFSEKGENKTTSPKPQLKSGHSTSPKEGKVNRKYCRASKRRGGHL